MSTMVAAYDEFLASKRIETVDAGFVVEDLDIQQALFPFQRDIVRWALRRGRAAIFAECGMGKTPMQLEWARHVSKRAEGPVLILAPLAVTEQTVEEGRKFGIEVVQIERQEDVQECGTGLYVTNYEKMHLFKPEAFVGIVLDESSILKSYMGKTKQRLLSAFAGTPYRLACTATPAPNDHTELGNHAEFLGIMSSGEMLTRWFITDTQQAQNLRLKGHGEGDFWRWVSSWAACLGKPSDLLNREGYPYSDEGFALPPLRLEEHTVMVDRTEGAEAQGHLFRMPVLGATEMHREMRLTAEPRAKRAVELVCMVPDEPCIVWCNTNYEADAVMRLLPRGDGEIVEVRGSDSLEEKRRKLVEFSEGRVRVIVTKPSIAGFGLNWQHCHRMVFVGLSYSFEQLYQALRRSYRFGQTHEVEAHLVVAETEGAVRGAITRKQEEHTDMKNKMVAAMRRSQLDGTLPGEGGNGAVDKVEAGPGIVEVEHGREWSLYLGDCVEATPLLAPNSVHLSVWSPPFSSLYTYTPSLRDMGNCEDDQEFFEHFRFLLPELWRVTVPGRLAAVHCKNLPQYKSKIGASGLRDFRGEVIKAFTDCNVGVEGGRWVYHSEVCIWKDPVREMQRTKTQGLLYKQLRQDASYSRQGLPDYLVIFRKWSPEIDSGEPVAHEAGEFPLEQWQRYASPVWFDINQTNVLNERIAREDKDEKHICPLQLDVIERAIELWTNPGDTVFSPFAGIGSEGYAALKLKRRFVGVELKEAYFRTAIRNLEDAASASSRRMLWTPEEIEAADSGPVGLRA